MNDMQSSLQKAGGKIASEADLLPPQPFDSPQSVPFKIEPGDDKAGVRLSIPRIPDHYFNGEDEIVAFLAAGTSLGVSDRKINVKGGAGNFAVKKGAASTTITCESDAFSNFVKDDGIVGQAAFFVTYAFGASPGHVSQPLAALLIRADSPTSDD